MTADKKKKFISDLRRCVQPMQDLYRSYQGLDEATTFRNGETTDGMNEDAIKNAKSIVYAANRLSGAVSDLIRQYDTEDSCRYSMNQDVDNPLYALFITEDGIFLRVPLAPYSVQRNAQRMAAAGQSTPGYNSYHGRRRYQEVDALLSQVHVRHLVGRKLLYILHVYNSRGSFRMSPDFDNFDVKDLIDVVMAYFGGDNVGNLAVLHDCCFSQSLPSATYLAVSEISNTKTIKEQIACYHECFERLDWRANR